MRVFLSWSGERSRQLAVALHDWLPRVIQAVEPWMSKPDIEKDASGMREIEEQLADSDYGILCVTPENLANPWLLFEAGAIAQEISARACPYLLGLDRADLGPPLGLLQLTEATREDTRRLVDGINERLGDSSLPADRVDDAFDTYWPRLEEEISELEAASPEELVRHRRTEGDLLVEILEAVRRFEQTGLTRELQPGLGPDLLQVDSDIIYQRGRKAVEDAIAMFSEHKFDDGVEVTTINVADDGLAMKPTFVLSDGRAIKGPRLICKRFHHRSAEDVYNLLLRYYQETFGKAGKDETD